MVAFDVYDRFNAVTTAAKAGTVSEEAWTDAFDDLLVEGGEPLVAVSEDKGSMAQGQRNALLPAVATRLWCVAVPGEPRKGFQAWLDRSVILW